MLKNLPRRQRLMALTSAAGLIFLATISTTVWVLSTSARPYLPGEEIEAYVLT